EQCLKEDLPNWSLWLENSIVPHPHRFITNDEGTRWKLQLLSRFDYSSRFACTSSKNDDLSQYDYR
ncbi:MAG: hypothetical protein WAK17_07170, partial [Candidatus Nitrosopolaris sp.]